MQNGKASIKRIVITVCVACLLIRNNAMATDIQSSGIIQDDYVVPSVEKQIESMTYSKRAVTLPACYDSRDNGFITEIENQGDTQICWSFSTIACAETAALCKGIAIKPNFSEIHLSYFFGKSVYDPLNICGNDSTYFVDEYLYAGGNNKYTTFALANWTGVADELQYPFIQEYYNDNLEIKNARNCSVRLKNAIWVPMSDADYVKKMIMDYGCVASSYYNLANYFSEDQCSYYNPLYTSTNHSIAIVGWDDNYEKEKFKHTPEGNGAWLIKGSWGTDFGEEGYYWISYYDLSISSSQTTAFVFDFCSAGMYDHNYFYDGSCGTKTRKIESGKSIANVFTICGNEEGKDEALSAIGIAIADSNVSYVIQIYKDVKGTESPTAGIPIFQEPIEGYVEAAGYYTIPLEEDILLRQGQRYSIRVTLSKEGSYNVNYFVDSTYENMNWIGFINETQPGQSFAQDEKGEWQDLHNMKSSARIKAYTRNLETCSPTKISFIKNEVTMRVGDKMSPKLTVTPQNADNSGRSWSSSNPLVASIDNQGIVTALSAGDTIIKVNQRDITASYTLHIIDEEIKEDSEEKDCGNEHTYDVGIMKTLPTCVTAGEKVYTCAICGQTKTEPVVATGIHIYSKWVEKKVATADVAGEKIRTCGICGHQERESIPAIGYVKGAEFKQGKNIYTIKSIKGKKGTVVYEGTEKISKKITVPSTIKADGKTYTVDEIAENAFKDNTKITHITIPRGVIKIGKNAFSGCKNLKKITIKSAVLKNVGKNAIKGINKKATIKVPKKQLKKYKKLFKSKTGYKKTMKIKK